MEFFITDEKLNKVVELFSNKELNRLKKWVSGIESLYDFYGEYDESYISGIEKADKFDVTEITRFDSNWIIHVIIHSNVGDFNWDLLIYEMERKLESMFNVHIDITVDGYKWSHKEENEI